MSAYHEPDTRLLPLLFRDFRVATAGALFVLALGVVWLASKVDP